MGTPLAEPPLKKKMIQEPEAGDANLEEKMAELTLCGTSSGIIKNNYGSKMGYMQMSDSHPTQRPNLASSTRNANRGGEDRTLIAYLSSRSLNEQSLNILQSMGQSIVIVDRNGLVAFWNEFSEHLYGYSTSEMLGRSALGPIIEERDFDAANEILWRTSSGECWTGKFPVRNKQGRRFQVIATHTPLFDDFGTLVGVVVSTCDCQSFLGTSPFSAGINLSPEAAYPSYTGPPEIGLPTTTGPASQEKPWEVVIASNLSNLTSRMTRKVRPKTATSERREIQGVDCSYIGDRYSVETVGPDGKEEISQGKQSGLITSLVEGTPGSGPSEGKEQNRLLGRTTTSDRFSFSLNHEQEVDFVLQLRSFMDSQKSRLAVSLGEMKLASGTLLKHISS